MPMLPAANGANASLNDNARWRTVQWWWVKTSKNTDAIKYNDDQAKTSMNTNSDTTKYNNEPVKNAM